MRTRVLWVMAAWLAACNGTSTGNPFDEPDDHGGEGTLGGSFANCDADPNELDSVDAPTPLGFTAADVLAFASGLHETTIRWQPSEIASYGPETGEHALSLRVTYAGGELRYIEYREAEGNGQEGGLLIATEPCMNHNAIEIEVDVEVTTDGGALDERVPGTLRASNDNWATLHVPLEAGELNGAFAVSETRPAGFTLVQLGLDFGLSPIGLRGSLGGVFEMRSGDAVGAAAGRGPIAAIGADASCDDGGLPVDLDDALDGMSGQNALDRVNDLGALRGTWRDGTSTDVTLELTHDGASVCALLESSYLYDAPAGSLRLRGTLAARSADERLDAAWPVIVQAVPAQGGGLGYVSVALELQALGQVPPAEVAAASGVRGVDGSGYDAVQLAFMLELPESAAVQGELLVQGLQYADCSTTPQSTPGGGMGTPGCAGATIVPLESLSLAD